MIKDKIVNIPDNGICVLRTGEKNLHPQCLGRIMAYSPNKQLISGIPNLENWKWKNKNWEK